MATPFIDSVLTFLPDHDGINSQISNFCSEHHVLRQLLDTLLRFSLGQPCPYASTEATLLENWNVKQSDCMKSFDSFAERSTGKRARTDEDSDPSTTNKKRKVNSDPALDGTPRFTLHALSVTSPVRKKVDVTITDTSIRLTNPATKDLESAIPLSSLTRAFLVPNMGKNKNKPRWTVILISGDTWDRKQEKADKESGADGQVQVIFGVDAAPTAAKDLLTTTTYPDEPVKHEKGSDTYPHLKKFLSFLPPSIQLLEASDNPSKAPTPGAQFSSTAGYAYVDAYRAAKEGSLHFMNVGILWGENKPCEFFALQDIARDEDGTGAAGVKILTATGRTFSLFVRRRFATGDSGSGDDEGEFEGEETEFAMIDGKEKENVSQWIRTHRHLFGKRSIAPSTKKIHEGSSATAKDAEAAEEDLADDSDASDEDFVTDSESDGGSATSSDSEEEGAGSKRQSSRSAKSGNDDDDDDEADGEDEAVESEEDSQDEEDNQSNQSDRMSASNHPLLREGAMPRLSRAAVDAVVGMVEDDMGVISWKGTPDEEDELDE
ncbi:hypothetical protein BD410DRAFT_480510 [Rickenella mellea]|uniref:Histone chaperone RTT106/FACT complex subunit SPT16-like middle domain-containing protein n=1 Tax=Rickenella mellea TaxID=50990 RepID=A0A4Y7QID9_9AGAM|nr:hypothetical protein BD410DRAFT_480510 [Rickenella mellea]